MFSIENRIMYLTNTQRCLQYIATFGSVENLTHVRVL